MAAESLSPPDTAEATAPTPPRMRRVMGSFASGVTVVTGLGRDGAPAGFACQSFASVSLEPALVLFCADHRGRAWPRIRETGRFTVNILAADQTDLCGRFGSGRGRKYEDLDWEPSPWGTPSLPDVLSRVHAEVYDVHGGGDHDVVVGRVLALETVSDRPPMLFFRGGFDVGGPADALAVPDVWGWGDHWG
ncbi:MULTISPECIES: flavin reductase family protein [Streptomyces]|uniref:Monooxygenase n=2 Tax=Streptomyces diastaticus group TaxID=2849069 RepID=A0A8H9LRK3_9ACTN|nr:MULTISPECIES: flavin reductase family protein [Streptomyces]NEE30666.1 flavin reductase family protein [Streptomyces sp. SID7982]NEE48771.1 flavin reductase family protein [Streptomyces sp. SID8455]MDQ0297390.1 flavin reductase (DIM6/NTAB) family NADH-FMN oxidoreductase RutF [Streptomyces sp. DSM 41037]PJM81558.1 flavin oxidoreductase [Streptomyces sp. TSRI0384-2]QNE79823.1 flavin reductase [Streptomyces rutgersensis]